MPLPRILGTAQCATQRFSLTSKLENSSAPKVFKVLGCMVTQAIDASAQAALAGGKVLASPVALYRNVKHIQPQDSEFTFKVILVHLLFAVEDTFGIITVPIKVLFFTSNRNTPVLPPTPPQPRQPTDAEKVQTLTQQVTTKDQELRQKIQEFQAAQRDLKQIQDELKEKETAWLGEKKNIQEAHTQLQQRCSAQQATLLEKASLINQQAQRILQLEKDYADLDTNHRKLVQQTKEREDSHRQEKAGLLAKAQRVEELDRIVEDLTRQKQEVERRESASRENTSRLQSQLTATKKKKKDQKGLYRATQKRNTTELNTIKKQWAGKIEECKQLQEELKAQKDTTEALRKQFEVLNQSSSGIQGSSSSTSSSQTTPPTTPSSSATKYPPVQLILPSPTSSSSSSSSTGTPSSSSSSTPLDSVMGSAVFMPRDIPDMRFSTVIGSVAPQAKTLNNLATYCDSLGLQYSAIQTLVAEGKKLYMDLENTKKTGATLREVKALAWYLFSLGMRKYQGFDEGSFVINGKTPEHTQNLHQFFAHAQGAYQVSFLQLSSHFKERRLKDSEYHLDLPESSSSSSSKDIFETVPFPGGTKTKPHKTLLLSLIEGCRKAYDDIPPVYLFLKPEDHGVDLKNPGQAILHVGEWVSSIARRIFSPEQNDLPNYRKDRIPRKVVNAFMLIQAYSTGEYAKALAAVIQSYEEEIKQMALLYDGIKSNTQELEDLFKETEKSLTNMKSAQDDSIRNVIELKISKLEEQMKTTKLSGVVQGLIDHLKPMMKKEKPIQEVRDDVEALGMKLSFFLSENRDNILAGQEEQIAGQKELLTELKSLPTTISHPKICSIDWGRSITEANKDGIAYMDDILGRHGSEIPDVLLKYYNAAVSDLDHREMRTGREVIVTDEDVLKNNIDKND